MDVSVIFCSMKDWDDEQQDVILSVPMKERKSRFSKSLCSGDHSPVTDGPFVISRRYYLWKWLHGQLARCERGPIVIKIVLFSDLEQTRVSLQNLCRRRWWLDVWIDQRSQWRNSKGIAPSAGRRACSFAFGFYVWRSVHRPAPPSKWIIRLITAWHPFFIF